MEKKKSWSSNGGTKVICTTLILAIIWTSIFATSVVNFNDSLKAKDEKLTTPFSSQTSNLITEQLSISVGTELIVNHSNAFSGLFHDSSDYEIEFNDAKLQTQLNGFDTIYNDTITPVDNLEEDYPNSFNRGIPNSKLVNSTGNLQSQDNDYYELLSESNDTAYLNSLDMNDLPISTGDSLETDWDWVTEYLDGYPSLPLPSCYVRLIASKNNREKVLKFYDNDNGWKAQLGHDLRYDEGTKTFGTIEFWVLAINSEKTFYLLRLRSEESYNLMMDLRISNGYFQAINVSTWENMEVMSNDTWYHVRLDFEGTANGYKNLTQYSYNVYINNHLYGNFGYSNNESRLREIDIRTVTSEIGSEFYMNAISTSWNYNNNLLEIGDNTNPEDPLGHYNGTYSFRNQPETSTSTDIDFVDIDNSAPNTSVNLKMDFGNHVKNLDLFDNNNSGKIIIYNNFSSNQTYGTIEFWFAINDTRYNATFFVRQNGVNRIKLRHSGSSGEIQYYYSNVWHDFDSGFPTQNNTWYHIRFDFRCSGAGAYLGLGSNRFNIYINGDYMQNTLMDGTATYLDDFELTTDSSGDNYHVYYDAFSYTWENYIIGYNKITDIYTLDFNFDLDYVQTENPLAIRINTYWNTSVYQNINLYIYNITGDLWDLLNTSVYYPSQIFQSFVFNSSITDYLSNTSIIKFRIFGENETNPFSLMMDQFEGKLYYKLSLTHSKAFSVLGTWGYRFFLSGSGYYSDWIYFDIIGESNNIEIISESEFYSKWDFIETNASGTNVYNEAFTTYGNWSSNLYGNFTPSNPDKFVGTPMNTDIDNFFYSGISYDIGSIVSNPVDLEYYNGSWYVLNNDDSCVYEFSLSWEYIQLYNLSSYGTDYHGFDYTSITDRWYIVDDANNRIDRFYNDFTYDSSPSATYGAETPRDIEIATGFLAGIYFILDKDEIQPHLGGMPTGVKNIISYETDCRGFHSIGAGSGSLYIAGNTNDSIHKFDYVSSTITYNTSFDISEQTTSPYAIESYGDIWWILGNSEKSIYRYNTGNAFNKTGIDPSEAIYVQTNISESFTLESPDLTPVDLTIGDHINLNFITTSTNAIPFDLYNGVDLVFSKRLIPENNLNFDDQTKVYVALEDFTFDKIEFSGDFDAETYFLLYSISIDRFNITQTVYLDPDGIKQLYLEYPISFYAFVFEKNLLIEQFEFTTSGTLQVLIFEKIDAELVYFTYLDMNNEYLDFKRFTTYVNYSYGEEAVYNERLAESFLYSDRDTLIYYQIYDSFEVIIKDGSFYNTPFMDITLNVYSLKVLNKAIEETEYHLTNIDSNIEKSGFLFPDEVKEFSIASGNYSLNYTNFEDQQIRIHDFEFTESLLIIINTTTYDVYFSIFNFDGLGLSNEIVRFYINNGRKDFGFNTLLQNTNRLTVTDYFNEIIYDSLVSLRQYTEYNILVEVYTLILNNNYTHSIYIEIERNDIELRQIIPSQSDISLRFLPDIKYTITSFYINGTEIEEKIVKLDKNNKIVNFGFYDITVPISPLPILNSVQMLIWFGFIIMGIVIIVIVLYFQIRVRDPKISDELRAILLQQTKKKKKSKKKNPFDDRDIYIDT